VIEQAGIQTTEDIDRVVPSQTFTGNVDTQGQAFSVRGIGTNVFGINTGQSTAFIVDDVATVQPGESIGNRADVERIEVLRGPQSPLFGKSASACAIVVTTKAPAEGLESSVEGTLTNDEQYRLSDMDGWDIDIAALVGAKLEYLSGLYHANSESERYHERNVDPALPVAQAYANSAAGTETSAVYGQATWHFTEATSVTAGLRYHDAEIRGEYTDLMTRAGTVSGDDDHSKVVGRITLKHMLGEETTVYASYATGYKGQAFDVTTGGFDEQYASGMRNGSLRYDGAPAYSQMLARNTCRYWGVTPKYRFRCRPGAGSAACAARSGGEIRRRHVADALHHRAQPVAARGAKVLQQVELFEIALDVEVEDRAWRAAVEGGEDDRDQAAHDQRVTVDREEDPTVALAPVEPHLALAAAHQQFLALLRRGKLRQFLAEVDDVAVAVFPVVEETDRLDDVLDAVRCPGRGVHALLRQFVRRFDCRFDGRFDFSRTLSG
jgi:hypothetical protein